MSDCLKESDLQAYFDAELASEKMEFVRRHLISCTGCAEVAETIAAENSILDTAFIAELSSPVPSDLLRMRIDEAVLNSRIEAIRSGADRPFTSRVTEVVVQLFTSKWSYAAVLGASFLFVAAGIAYKIIRVPVDPRTSAAVRIPELKGMDLNNALSLGASEPAPAPRPLVTPVKFIHRSMGKIASPRSVAPTVAVASPLPGEAGYIKAIAALTDAIESGGENALKPGVRADYLRNIAVVDRAIDSTRKTARQYPRDRDAVAFLYSSYQSKVDLLNAVADQSLLAAR